MQREDIVKMSKKEVRRIGLIHKVIERTIKQEEGGRLLGLTSRQIRRIIKRVKREGDLGIVHRSRGRESNRRISKKIRKKVINLYKTKYWDFGPTLASEKIEELDGIKLSDETLRLWLVKEGIWDKRRKSRVHRQWRERRACFGEMIQIDGSHHNWLEERGPKLVLMGYIDDATGEAFGRFYDYEGTIPALDSFIKYVKLNGIPQTVYVDCHSTYKANKKNIWENERTFSQFEKALGRLQVQVIHAGSPQAKGRIERLFRTFQDRLIKEMRLAGVRTKEEANVFLEGYLPRFNERFEKQPKSKEDLHREVPLGMDLKSELSIQESRVLRNDNTIQYEGEYYQIKKGWMRRPKVLTVELHVDRSLHIRDGGCVLKYFQIEKPANKEGDTKVRGYCHMGHIPSQDHPWRKGFSLRRPVTGVLNGLEQTIVAGAVSHDRVNFIMSSGLKDESLKRKKEAKKEIKGRAAARFATAGFQGPALRSQQLIKLKESKQQKPDISTLAETGHF
ncbi:MAG: ISNCY family transposase [Chlamydiota bacterium]|nr:ISNCY family transposase [Chlamydiota bacterium]